MSAPSAAFVGVASSLALTLTTELTEKFPSPVVSVIDHETIEVSNGKDTKVWLPHRTKGSYRRAFFSKVQVKNIKRLVSKKFGATPMATEYRHDANRGSILLIKVPEKLRPLRLPKSTRPTRVKPEPKAEVQSTSNLPVKVNLPAKVMTTVPLPDNMSPSLNDLKGFVDGINALKSQLGGLLELEIRPDGGLRATILVSYGD